MTETSKTMEAWHKILRKAKCKNFKNYLHNKTFINIAFHLNQKYSQTSYRYY